MVLKKEKIKRILVISLSNIGDIILTFPVLDVLREDFPDADISVVIGPKGEGLLRNNPAFPNLYIFDKRQKFLKTVRWIWSLRQGHFDLIVDLRNTAIPYFLSCSYHTSLFLRRSRHKHMCWQHLNRLKHVYPYEKQTSQRYALFFSDGDKKIATDIINDKIGPRQSFVLVAPGAADRGKRWAEVKYAELADCIIEQYHQKIVFVGDQKDRLIVQGVIKKMKNCALNLAGQLTLPQLGFLMQHTCMLITNDSAPCHLASYLNIPVVAIFGPSDHHKYGPWSETNRIIERKSECPVCRGEKKAKGHQCLEVISVDDVFNSFTIDLNKVYF